MIVLGKKIAIFLLSVTLAFSFLLNFNTVAHASNENQIMGLPDLTPLKGAYVKSNQYASGGRVNIDYEYLYMTAADGRLYASKVETSLTEAATWIAVSWIPNIGPIAGTLSGLSMLERSAFATAIRQYTDQNQHVRIVLSYDKFIGFKLRTVGLWDGRIGGVKNHAGTVIKSKIWQ